MNKGREVGDNIFESIKGFDRFGFGRSMMMPSVFRGKDPFDDPFFSDPFDRLFCQSSASRTMQKTSKEKGLIIQELASDDDDNDTEDVDHRISRSTMEPSVEHPDDDDDVNEKKNNSIAYKNDHYKVEPPKAQNFSFQTSRVTYGGVDGVYYTSSRTRRTGSDGAIMEESREADTITGQASHRISRGLHDKGHSLLKKLDSNGKVNTTQTLHNLNEDELEDFEKAWKGNNIGLFHGCNNVGYDMHNNKGSNGDDKNRNHVWPLPLLEHGRRGRGSASNHEQRTNSKGTTKKNVVRINIE